MGFLTDRTLATGVTLQDLIHIVITGDTSQGNLAGSSYKAKLQQVIDLNTIVVKNTVYVMKNGDDSAGLVERFDKPFLTINAAINAIRTAYPDVVRTPSNRFKVVVEDGTYIETSTIYIYPYIDFDFGNSIIDANFYDNPVGITFSSNPNNDFTTKIFGNSKIKVSGGTLFQFENPGTRILIECDTLYSEGDDCIGIVKGYCRIICNLIINNSSSISSIFYHAIEMLQKDNTSPCVLDVVNATITQGPLNNRATPIHFGTAGSFTNPLNQTLNLYNCRVINTNSGVGGNNELSAISVGVTHTEPSGSTLNLYNSVLYSLNGKTIFVSNSLSTANLDVYYYNMNSLNNTPTLTSPGVNYSLNEYILSSRIVDSNVSPNVF
jgi:hypothetical protein